MSTPAAPIALSFTAALTAKERQQVGDLEAAAARADGVDPLDDQVRLEVAYGAVPDAQHVLGRRPGEQTVTAYAHLSADDDGASAHLVVDPPHRRQGLGAALLDELSKLGSERAVTAGAGPTTGSGRLRVWAHGDTAGAQALAASHGFTRVRDLWQMRRPLTLELPAATYPDDVSVRAFEPGRDDEAWVALNAAAFADHPEQGKLTVGDLRHRIEQPWFDAAGFFLAERSGELLGSHWTKVHPAVASPVTPGGPPASAAIGEVYAVGVHPAAQGLGLGKALTLTGLHHLRDLGLSAVMLYVDGDNTAAVALYQRLGFETTTVDVMYASPT